MVHRELFENKKWLDNYDGAARSRRSYHFSQHSVVGNPSNKPRPTDRLREKWKMNKKPSLHAISLLFPHRINYGALRPIFLHVLKLIGVFDIIFRVVFSFYFGTLNWRKYNPKNGSPNIVYFLCSLCHFRKWFLYKYLFRYTRTGGNYLVLWLRAVCDQQQQWQSAIVSCMYIYIDACSKRRSSHTRRKSRPRLEWQVNDNFYVCDGRCAQRCCLHE